MGYDLEITRSQYSSDKLTWVEVEAMITPEEWLLVVENDPDLALDALNEKTSPLRAWWSGPGKYPCWLDYYHGTLYSKNPTEEMIDKMVQIAKLLNAKVVGEEAEEYLGNGRVTTLEWDGEKVQRLTK